MSQSPRRRYWFGFAALASLGAAVLSVLLGAVVAAVIFLPLAVGAALLARSNRYYRPVMTGGGVVWLGYAGWRAVVVGPGSLAAVTALGGLGMLGRAVQHYRQSD